MLVLARKVAWRALLVLVVACASSVGGAPALTAAAEAEMPARAVAVGCAQYCIGDVVFVRDRMYETMDPPTPGDPLTEVQQVAIKKQFGAVQFVNDEEASAVHAEDGVVFVVGPIRQSSKGLVEVEVSAEGFDSTFTQIQPFDWDGRDWIPASRGDTAATVTTLI